MTGLLEIADQLYGLAPAEFPPARDARAKELRSSDRELSDRVKALKKPSVAAWAVNQLVRHEADQVEQVLAVGAALRQAQESLDGDELRALTRQRRQLTSAVTSRARGVCADLGVRLTDAAADLVEATLTAAMVDPTAAEAVRSGLLVAPLSATGVGEVEVSGALAASDALGFAAAPVEAEEPVRPDLRVVPDPDADAKARRAKAKAAGKALAAAEAALGKAERVAAKAGRAVEDLQARALELSDRQDELRRRLAELESEQDDLDDQLAEAEEDRAAAESAAEEAARARDAAQAAVDELD